MLADWSVAKCDKMSIQRQYISSSWQRGLNENTNGLIRDIYPKRTDFRCVHDRELLTLQNTLNNRPRKTLNYATPANKMVEYLTQQVANL